MNKSLPRTSFSTPLSRSAMETEIKHPQYLLRAKKRPPVLFLILMFSVCIFCGNLVACRPLPVQPTLVMETQYYDNHNNYIEIPVLALPAGEENEAVDAINGALNDLRGQYSGPLDNSENFWEEQCLFYPSTTDRYLNLLFYRDNYTSDLNISHVFSLVCDLKDGTLVPTEDALALAGLNEKDLLDQVTEQILAQIARDTQEDDLNLALYDLTIEGFRVKADGKPVFYLTGRIDDVGSRDDVSGADYLYIWEGGAVTTYDQYSGKPSLLVPAEETDQLDPPLWNQWYFAGKEPTGGFKEPDNSAFSDLGQDIKSGLDRIPDLNRNGIPEELKLVEEKNGDLMLEVWENGKILFREPGEFAYPEAEFLCTLDGKDYLLCYQNWDLGGQGSYHYSYDLTDFGGEFKESERSASVDFDLNFGSPYHKNFDPEAIAALVDQVNELLPHCELLFCTSPDLLATFEKAGRLEDNLSWLDDFPDVFTRDPEKSLLENLRDFQAAMPPDWTPPTPENDPELLFDQPIEMTFSSGAGGWQTVITLHGDGSFQGGFEDADMDTHYVCQFHGRFGDMAPISDSSWYLVLKELVPDTKYPVGQKWDEGGIHYISTNPYGFDTPEGRALQPGAGFIFYYPDATGHEPGTELYGAYEFWTWWPDRHVFQSSTDTLGCYGLQNLETGYGFFSHQ